MLAMGACIAIAPEGIHQHSAAGGGGSGAGGDTGIDSDAGPPANPPPDASTVDPHAVIGATPSHGPFAGGGSVLVRGNGFTSKVRVWFGATEVNETESVPIDPQHVQVVAPAGTAGTVDLTAQDGSDASTSRTLAGGYTYDALYAVPNTGPTPGGTVIEIVGQGTAWDTTTVAKIDNMPCTTLTVNSPTLLTCTVPADTPGSKTITVTTGAETILVLDAYVYADSTNGYKGGLSGDPLAGNLKVLAYDNYTGDPIPGALVIVGSDASTAIVTTADASGVALISDPSLASPQTVTIAGTCHSPVTFVAEPVDTVTAYLDPVLSPLCAGSGDIPPTGGNPVQLGEIQGEIVWPESGEFMRGGWQGVPSPIGPHERQAAYVFVGGSDPTYPFQLPDPSSAVLPTTPGDIGYDFAIDAYPGNVSLYAIAGIEDDSLSPPTFTGWVMGAVNAVPVLPAQVTPSIYIQMSNTLDQALIMDVTPPAPGPAGPDRLLATVAVSLGAGGYAILPAGQQSPFLPVMGMLDFVGVPVLDDDLVGSVYFSTASAVTGQAASAPMSVIASMQSTTTSQVLDVTGFVSIPVLTAPEANTTWDDETLATTFAFGGAQVDLTVYDIQAGGGIAHWLIAVPGAPASTTVPDLSGFPGMGLPSGPLNIAVYGANITGFDYSQLTYQELYPQGMSAYALDYFNANL
jgi:IPT/TIG domain